MTSKKLGAFSLSAAAFALLGAQAIWAAPGDIHRVVNAELVNLRAGPSNEANVRGQVRQGDEVIELTSDSGWVGVRVLDTGEEGWIFSELLESVARSTLGPAEGVVSDAGFRRLSEGFNQLIGRINDDLGYPIVQGTEQPDERVLRVAPTHSWLINGSRDAHLMAATAFYQMWKNHQNNQPVELVMLNERGEEYITITDETNGPDLRVAMPQ